MYIVQFKLGIALVWSWTKYFITASTMKSKAYKGYLLTYNICTSLRDLNTDD